MQALLEERKSLLREIAVLESEPLWSKKQAGITGAGAAGPSTLRNGRRENSEGSLEGLLRMNDDGLNELVILKEVGTGLEKGSKEVEENDLELRREIVLNEKFTGTVFDSNHDRLVSVSEDGTTQIRRHYLSGRVYENSFSLSIDVQEVTPIRSSSPDPKADLGPMRIQLTRTKGKQKQFFFDDEGDNLRRKKEEEEDQTTYTIIKMESQVDDSVKAEIGGWLGHCTSTLDPPSFFQSLRIYSYMKKDRDKVFAKLISKFHNLLPEYDTEERVRGKTGGKQGPSRKRKRRRKGKEGRVVEPEDDDSETESEEEEEEGGRVVRLGGDGGPILRFRNQRGVSLILSWTIQFIGNHGHVEPVLKLLPVIPPSVYKDLSSTSTTESHSKSDTMDLLESIQPKFQRLLNRGEPVTETVEVFVRAFFADDL